MRRSRVHVMGASGAGTTILARALADHWAVPHADADDYFWVPSTPPHVDKRPAAERVALMRSFSFHVKPGCCPGRCWAGGRASSRSVTRWCS